MRIELFGGLRVLLPDNSFLELEPSLPATLLALLALDLGRVIPRSELAASLWPDDNDESGRKKLRSCLHELRRRLDLPRDIADSAFLATRAAISLNRDAISTDVGEFNDALNHNKASNGDLASAERLGRALEIYSGTLLPGHFHERIDAERIRLESAAYSAAEKLLELSEASGDREGAAKAAARLIQLEPASEAAHAILIQKHISSGRTAGAHRQYQALETALSEFGAVPSESTTGLLATMHVDQASREARPPEAFRDGAVSVATAVDVPDTPLKQPGDGTNVPEPGGAYRSGAPAGRLGARSPAGRRKILATAVMAATALVIVSISFVEHIRKGADSDLQRPIPAADLVWRWHYVPPVGDGDSDPTAIAVDAAGNSYVTGFVQTARHDVDFLTAKIDRNGRTVWTDHYNGPANDVDRARALALAPDGSVYVTGDSMGKTGNGRTRLSGLDYATVKYDRFGHRAWVERYDGPANGEDVPTSMCIDARGNVVVTGRSWSDRTSGFGIATVAYSPGGRQIWYARCDVRDRSSGGTDICADRQGNVYVCATSKRKSGPGEAIVLSYGASGKRRWMRTVPQAADADITRLAVLPAGVALLNAEPPEPSGTGQRAAVRAFGLDGAFLWSCPLALLYGHNLMRDRGVAARPAAIEAAPSGNVVVATQLATSGGEVCSQCFFRISASGSVLWSCGYPTLGAEQSGIEPGKYDQTKITDMSTDEKGAITWTGYQWDKHLLNGAGDSAWTTERIMPDGTVLWRAVDINPEQRTALGRAIATNRTGAYAAAQADTAGTRDIVVVKYGNRGAAH